MPTITYIRWIEIYKGFRMALRISAGIFFKNSSPVVDGSLESASKEQLMSIKGIGPWTADIYLLIALGRPDIWPNGDIALASAVQKLKGVASRPSFKKLNRMSLKWTPWRAVAARIL